MGYGGGILWEIRCSLKKGELIMTAIGAGMDVDAIPEICKLIGLPF
jgi:hypothetical protein